MTESLRRKEPDEATLLVEYQKAQDSAEHHDNLVGNVTSLWLGSAILIGFVLSALPTKAAVHYKTVLVLVIVLALALIAISATWVLRADENKQTKYTRCQEIESLLGMEQHSRIKPGRRWMTGAYLGLMGLFAAVWIALLVDVARL